VVRGESINYYSNMLAELWSLGIKYRILWLRYSDGGGDGDSDGDSNRQYLWNKEL
jgi:hypothetical protein